MNQIKNSVAVGSINPVKIAAVSSAFASTWPKIDWRVQGITVTSGVSNQPMSDRESIKGARNRAREAQKLTQAAYGVGLEGGLQKIGSQWFDCGWIAIIDHRGLEGYGSTARIITPPKMMAVIQNEGQELGVVVDRFFNTVNAKQSLGHFGLMTNGAITRTSGYRDGVVMALVRFLHPELW